MTSHVERRVKPSQDGSKLIQIGRYQNTLPSQVHPPLVLLVIMCLNITEVKSSKIRKRILKKKNYSRFVYNLVADLQPNSDFKWLQMTPCALILCKLSPGWHIQCNLSEPTTKIIMRPSIIWFMFESKVGIKVENNWSHYAWDPWDSPQGPRPSSPPEIGQRLAIQSISLNCKSLVLPQNEPPATWQVIIQTEWRENGTFLSSERLQGGVTRILIACTAFNSSFPRRYSDCEGSEFSRQLLGQMWGAGLSKHGIMQELRRRWRQPKTTEQNKQTAKMEQILWETQPCILRAGES